MSHEPSPEPYAILTIQHSYHRHQPMMINLGLSSFEIGNHDKQPQQLFELTLLAPLGFPGLTEQLVDPSHGCGTLPWLTFPKRTH